MHGGLIIIIFIAPVAMVAIAALPPLTATTQHGQTEWNFLHFILLLFGALSSRVVSASSHCGLIWCFCWLPSGVTLFQTQFPHVKSRALTKFHKPTLKQSFNYTFFTNSNLSSQFLPYIFAIFSTYALRSRRAYASRQIYIFRTWSDI